ncbi:hypothetical protein NPIL_664931 [Nephila pilipes]|uniref:Uncharacterized protein n=1 Tax=Nephila pilipes TaxID=299642 RepID=A0A8X6UJ28_NEPPI|nr:hypothetical protein NPIL_664931 [Nephila pilipes]
MKPTFLRLYFARRLRQKEPAITTPRQSERHTFSNKNCSKMGVSCRSRIFTFSAAGEYYRIILGLAFNFVPRKTFDDNSGKIRENPESRDMED